jgi:hypothetical protein
VLVDRPSRNVFWANRVSATFRGMQHDLEATWPELKIPNADFDVTALHMALEARRIERGISWKAVVREVNRSDERYGVHPMSQ